MKIKTSELTGLALDWAVCKAEGDELAARNIEYPNQAKHFPTISPSTDWSLAGTIIEREGIEINVRNWTPSPGCRLPGKYEWSARLCYVRQTDCKQFGPTPLIAAMRCYVDSKLGLEIDVPEELL